MVSVRSERTIPRVAVSIIACLLLLSAFPYNCESGNSEPAPGQRDKTKNVILFIGDGMGFEQVKAAGIYAFGESGTLSFESFPYTGSISTNNAEGKTTDSAAAATAMATGVKVLNGVISMEIPGSGRPMETIMEHYKAMGKWTGFVTSYFDRKCHGCGFCCSYTKARRLRQHRLGLPPQVPPQYPFRGRGLYLHGFRQECWIFSCRRPRGIDGFGQEERNEGRRPFQRRADVLRVEGTCPISSLIRDDAGSAPNSGRPSRRIFSFGGGRTHRPRLPCERYLSGNLGDDRIFQCRRRGDRVEQVANGHPDCSDRRP